MSTESEKQKVEATAEQVAQDNLSENSEDPPELSPEERIVNLEAQIADLADQNLRRAAEFENFRKRMNKEKQEAIEFANQALLLDLIPVLDDFERAIKSGETIATQAPEFTSLLEGVSMTEKLLLSLLENKWGLKRYDSEGEIFDPALHEAIMVEKSTEVMEPLVQSDYIKGYMLKDRVIRSAKVNVLMPENPGTGSARVEDTKNEE